MHRILPGMRSYAARLFLFGLFVVCCLLFVVCCLLFVVCLFVCLFLAVLSLFISFYPLDHRYAFLDCAGKCRVSGA
jgi:hypothetical protein